MPKRHYSQKIPGRIAALLADDLVKMDVWAFDKFLPSILGQFAKKGNITDGQYQHLVRLEEKFSNVGKVEILQEIKEKSDALKVERDEWEKEYFGTDIEAYARIVAEYYRWIAKQGGEAWYENAVTCILDGKLPQKRGCTRMINNTYAQSVLAEYKKEPKYPIKSIVRPRKKNFENPSHPLYGVEFAFVMKVNVNPAHPAEGGKSYLVLPKGNLKGIVCQERELKAYRRKK